MAVFLFLHCCGLNPRASRKYSGHLSTPRWHSRLPPTDLPALPLSCSGLLSVPETHCMVHPTKAPFRSLRLSALVHLPHPPSSSQRTGSAFSLRPDYSTHAESSRLLRVPMVTCTFSFKAPVIVWKYLCAYGLSFNFPAALGSTDVSRLLLPMNEFWKKVFIHCPTRVFWIAITGLGTVINPGDALVDKQIRAPSSSGLSSGRRKQGNKGINAACFEGNGTR